MLCNLITNCKVVNLLCRLIETDIEIFKTAIFTYIKDFCVSIVQDTFTTTFFPGERILEAVEEVEDDPRYDDIVVEANVHDDKDRGNPDTSEVGEELLPH